MTTLNRYCSTGRVFYLTHPNELDEKNSFSVRCAPILAAEIDIPEKGDRVIVRRGFYSSLSPIHTILYEEGNIDPLLCDWNEEGYTASPLPEEFRHLKEMGKPLHIRWEQHIDGPMSHLTIVPETMIVSLSEIGEAAYLSVLFG